MTSLILTDAIREASDPTAVMQRVTEQALLLIPHADGASLEMRRGEDLLEYVCAAGSLAPFVGLQLGMASSLSGRAVVAGKLLHCQDTEVDPRVDRAACIRTGVRSMLCVPLASHGGRGVAALKVSSRRPGAFSSSDERTLRELADFLSVTVNAAAELARATARILAAQPDPEVADCLHEAETARFVANVMSPGLFDDVEAALRIRQVLAAGEFTTVAQPVYDLRTGAISSVEALTRFPGPPLQGPDRWFAQADAVGLGVELELAAVASAMSLLAQVPEHISVSVNLGPDTLPSPELVQILEPVDHHRVIIELTEHVPVADYLALAGPLAKLRESGIRLAIDDTGSGYSSLSHIRRLGPDIIKLDRELVRDIDTDPVLQALATALVQFTRGVRALVVAEGIETEAEARALVGLGIGLGQGYFLHRPAPIGQIDWNRPWLPIS